MKENLTNEQKLYSKLGELILFQVYLEHLPKEKNSKPFAGQ